MTRLPIALARRMALHAQGLAGPPDAAPTPQDVATVVHRIGCLQLDPVAPVARSPLLVLHARVRGGMASVERALQRAAYGDRALLDFWCHEASLVHVGDLAVHRWWMRRPRRAEWERFLDANAGWTEWLLATLRERGPVRAHELEEQAEADWQHGWWTDEVSHRQTVGRLLHGLWLKGVIGVHDRDAGGARRWHLMEECLPPGALEATEELDDREVTRRAAVRAVRMLGVAKAGHVRDHFTRRRYPLLDEVLPEVCVPVEVEGTRGTWWALEEDLDRAPQLPPGRRTVALSPFDNLICDRARTAELFGFDHRLEIYTPQAKRRWGYYVLPVLHGERFVARADLKVVDGELRVLSLHHEPGRRAPGAVRAALERLARWRGATLGDLP